MLQLNEYVNVNDKIEDKINQIEQRRRIKLTEKERKIAFEMFMSGFLFSQQWNGNEFVIEPHVEY
mgnify:CR=1 FL=1|nr:hypothetical protein DGKKSRWO_DGKKSRWO_CDS_0095 [uncultured phage]CAI9752272.1 hypothetical protein CVNMHQAP_CVNMHQAP_CDS_0095 [uncultured phage]